MNVGDKVIVRDNLKDELKKLTFDDSTCESMHERFANTEQEIFDLWENDDGQKYATVDLCCEIPVQCLEVICWKRSFMATNREVISVTRH